MYSDVLEKVKLLPPEKQLAVEAFVNNLLKEYNITAGNEQSVAEKRRKNVGRLKDQIQMTDDFNDTPEDFKDYL